ncbi:hypothetical protein ACFLRT_03385 [Acidobacteriota bacterium]
MTVVKRTLKIVLVIIMLVGMTISVFNLLSVENQAIGIQVPGEQGDGTTIVLPDGGIDCQGAPLDC